mmetsp:Transcript_69741/g.191361  ORF Transcript_69741/g.191361 Transcript_69741/m.191361 type:complete len:230 (-) Transcript_69741:184-873(-)
MRAAALPAAAVVVMRLAAAAAAQVDAERGAPRGAHRAVLLALAPRPVADDELGVVPQAAVGRCNLRAQPAYEVGILACAHDLGVDVGELEPAAREVGEREESLAARIRHPVLLEALHAVFGIEVALVRRELEREVDQPRHVHVLAVQDALRPVRRAAPPRRLQRRLHQRIDLELLSRHEVLRGVPDAVLGPCLARLGVQVAVLQRRDDLRELALGQVHQLHKLAELQLP